MNIINNVCLLTIQIATAKGGKKGKGRQVEDVEGKGKRMNYDIGSEYELFDRRGDDEECGT